MTTWLRLSRQRVATCQWGLGTSWTGGFHFQLRCQKPKQPQWHGADFSDHCRFTPFENGTFCSRTQCESPRINHPSIGSQKPSDSPTWGVCRLEGLMLSSSLRHPRDPQYPTDNVTQFVTEVLEGDWGPCADNRPKKIFLNHGVISYKLRSHSVRVLGFWLRWFLPLFGEDLY